LVHLTFTTFPELKQFDTERKMNLQNHTNLDNPVWHSLKEAHEKFAINYGHLKCYHPDYCPFGGYENRDQISEGMNAYARLTDSFYIVGDNPGHFENLTLKKELVCLQMVLDQTQYRYHRKNHTPE
jgi:hypothetical protein